MRGPDRLIDIIVLEKKQRPDTNRTGRDYPVRLFIGLTGLEVLALMYHSTVQLMYEVGIWTKALRTWASAVRGCSNEKVMKVHVAILPGRLPFGAILQERKLTVPCLAFSKLGHWALGTGHWALSRELVTLRSLAH